MSDKAFFVEGEHGPAVVEGPATALSWLTVLPLKGATAFDRTTGGRVMMSLPVVGVVLGAVGALLAVCVSLLGSAGLLCGTLVVVAWQLLTRFMHLDGLADVADALGSYAPPERAREILADPHAGLIGMASALLVMLVQIASIAQLSAAGVSVVVFVIPVVGRLCTMVGGSVRFSPMKPTGFAAMVVGTVPTKAIVLWSLVVIGLGAGIASLAGFPVLVGAGVFAVCVLVCLGVAVVLARHCVKRFEGLNGDTCGFINEITASVCAAVLAVLVSFFLTSP
ncbi:adenosylcobinamide-GDP ribazoletransferase [Corynebacterium felinum]|uniref:Adenosylcobinamide-GDP ribazoletransferase n=1 Tax=Corynebacterium felinum TaxID=131318 RepID=A0ABU2BC22_9CORY|nr:adenosylcobinamide-GDP ribazoletransferase [Corynebacterium felinum]MDF5820399.1 adenosylcobinamide-GDP ribazoletransferase [Corynebacterium felinum]MDR7356180.1 adenosylcobinamide-GDP ribazoletransferase [Corynebacterium felinum]WJY95514.1 Cobalamin synthase [Corynebacterium felinum]